jgi:type I restriction enzyme M protein
MSTASQQIVNKAWNFAHVLRDEGLSYMAYTEQITFLLFLKMADEYTRPPYDKEPIVPSGLDWRSLLEQDGDELDTQYRHILSELSKQPGMLGEIFKKARADIQNPATLKRLIVDLINKEHWVALDADVKGDIYEGLLAKSAAESPKGAGQYFTPRALIQGIVDVMQPGPKDMVCDPACGTCGFLLAAYDYVFKYHKHLDPDQLKHMRTKFVHGCELVPNTARLGIMNLYLHGINADPCPITSGQDSLISDSGDRFSMVLTNPPFGKKSTVTIVGEDGEAEKDDMIYDRQDFWTTTKNKQLNFVQHITTLLGSSGRCAIVVPDNVLFEGGAGEVVRKRLLKECDVHTLLRLPTGIFYAQGVKANVIFYDARKGGESVATSHLWVYDLRTNMHFTLKTTPLQRKHLDEFVICFNPKNRHERHTSWSEENPNGRWRCFSYEEIIRRDKCNLDISWLKDKSLEDAENLPEPDVLAQEILEDLQMVIEQFAAIVASLGDDSALSLETPIPKTIALENSVATFPEAGREALAYEAVAAMMRDFPKQTFPVICRASWFLTNAKNCQALLPVGKRRGFMTILKNLGLAQDFPEEQKIRFWAIKHRLELRGMTIFPIGGGHFRVPDGFDFRDALDMRQLAPYLFEAVQRLELQSADSEVVEIVKQTMSQQTEMIERAA